MFALRHKESGKLLGFYTSSNDDMEDCGSTSTRLELNPIFDNVWVVTKRSIAEKATDVNVDWYNAEFDTPQNEYVGQLEVVELVLSDQLKSMQARIYDDECGVPT